MKSVVFEYIKITLLSVITILVGIDVINNKHDKISSNQQKNVTNQREHDLKRIMVHSLSQLFKFPESVKFKDTKYQYKRVFKDHGLDIAPEKELEFAVLCGQYSAQNAMGVYGTFNPFYTEIAVNNEEKGITGDVWLKIDGEIKKLFSLDSSFTLDGDKEEFKKLYAKNCGDFEKAHMGMFSQYDVGYAALLVKYHLEDLDKLAKYPNAKTSLQSCSNSGVSLDNCIGFEKCLRIKDLGEEMSEFCTLQKKICTIDDNLIDCESKIKNVYKEKKSSNK